MKLTNKKGFTLIELIIVIAILGIIALIAIPNLAGIRQRSQVSADKRTAEQIGKAVRIWATDTDAAATRTIPTSPVLYTASKDVTKATYDDAVTAGTVATNCPLYGLTPDYISDGYVAKSHKTGEGKFFVSSVGGGTNNANQKIVVGIASDGKDKAGTTVATYTNDINKLTGSGSAATSVTVGYNGGDGGWAYQEQ